MCSSHCSNRLSQKAAIDTFNWSYLCPRYLTIIYNCLIIYFTLNIHATTHDNSITSLTTPFHQSVPNSRSDWRCDLLPNQRCASVQIYFQGVYCNINTLVLYHLSVSTSVYLYKQLLITPVPSKLLLVFVSLFQPTIPKYCHWHLIDYDTRK